MGNSPPPLSALCLLLRTEKERFVLWTATPYPYTDLNAQLWSTGNLILNLSSAAQASQQEGILKNLILKGQSSSLLCPV